MLWFVNSPWSVIITALCTHLENFSLYFVPKLPAAFLIFCGLLSIFSYEGLSKFFEHWLFFNPFRPFAKEGFFLSHVPLTRPKKVSRANKQYLFRNRCCRPLQEFKKKCCLRATFFVLNHKHRLNKYYCSVPIPNYWLSSSFKIEQTLFLPYIMYLDLHLHISINHCTYFQLSQQNIKKFGVTQNFLHSTVNLLQLTVVDHQNDEKITTFREDRLW